jgi:predicted secreted hydrolase
MNKILEIPYPGRKHGTFAQEWISHKKTSEWWYATGYFCNKDDKMYSYQFTVLRPLIMGARPLVLHLALTDFDSGKHYFTQTLKSKESEIRIDETTVQFGADAKVVKGETAMHLTCNDKDFSLDLMLDYGKGAVWHCDDGYLLMGSAKTKESTSYYSYTNMPTVGTLIFEGKEMTVSGKSWFDKQGGPYSLMSVKTHWEWFSLRFFDDEELMLFTFPQNNYQDGTYISQDGKPQRLTDYTVTPKDFVVEQDLKFSSGWSLHVPNIKDTDYELRPLFKGQMNIGYFEQLCGIYNKAEEKVGIAIVELLPGAYNKKFKKQLTKNASHFAQE